MLVGDWPTAHRPSKAFMDFSHITDRLAQTILVPEVGTNEPGDTNVPV